MNSQELFKMLLAGIIVFFIIFAIYDAYATKECLEAGEYFAVCVNQ